MSAAAEIEKPDYTYWMNGLAGTFGPVHDGDPQPGFYRKRTGKAAGYVPVAIWPQGGKMVALVDGKEADAAEIWSYVCQYPILEEWYRARMVGQPWPDESAAVTASLAPPPSGHNNPPTDEAEILQGQIEAASAGAAEYHEISDDATASKAQSLRSRLLELSGNADKLREDRKRPHLEAGKAIDAKFMPLVKVAKAAADGIRSALSAHETRKAREADRIRREAEEARLKAEREAAQLRGEAENAAREAENAGLPAPAPPAPIPEPEPPAPAPVPEAAVAIRGAYGRAAAVKVVKVAKVVDQDAAYMAMRTHKELVELIAKLAQRAAVAGVEVAGVEVTEERAVA
jgi:hypothetical protein